MKPLAATVLRAAGWLAAGLLLAGFLATLLVRSAPGYGTDERVLDPSLSEPTRREIARSAAGRQSLWREYRDTLVTAARGDFGRSASLNRPVVELLAQRAPVTLKTAGAGLAVAWILGPSLAACAVLWQYPRGAIAALNTMLFCIPAALAAMVMYSAGIPASGVVAMVSLPKVTTYLQALLEGSASRPHVQAATARGVPAWRVFLVHRVWPAAPELAALFGVSITLAAGASIPAEALCDTPGLGQLAWKAALARDVAPLVTLTWLFSAVTLSANTCGAMLARRRVWHT